MTIEYLIDKFLNPVRLGKLLNVTRLGKKERGMGIKRQNERY